MVQVHVARLVGFKKYEFLLLKRSATQKVFPFVWQVITGKKKEDETFIHCAVREILEETNLVPTEMWALPFVATFYLQSTDSIHHSPVFGVLVDALKTVEISNEHEEFAWVTEEEALKRLVMPSHREGTEIFLREILLKEDQKLFKIPDFRKDF